MNVSLWDTYRKFLCAIFANPSQAFPGLLLGNHRRKVLDTSADVLSTFALYLWTFCLLGVLWSKKVVWPCPSENTAERQECSARTRAAAAAPPSDVTSLLVPRRKTSLRRKFSRRERQKRGGEEKKKRKKKKAASPKIRGAPECADAQFSNISTICRNVSALLSMYGLGRGSCGAYLFNCVVVEKLPVQQRGGR